MAVWTIKTQSELSSSFVLAPERYDPRRAVLPVGREQAPLLVSTVARVIRRTVTSSTAPDASYLVLDTSHAQEGVIVSPKSTVQASQLGSAKKIVETGDVIISRLRPYLRQIALIDAELCEPRNRTHIVCSTEYFVLRSVNEESIAFLVPFLLSTPIQEVLAASQEGGHHPRFNEPTLTMLPIPLSLIETRHQVSEAVLENTRSHRRSERGMKKLVEICGQLFYGKSQSKNEDDNDHG
jgi:hypothetical protein